MINFSFDSKYFGFAKCGKIGYISINNKKIFIFVAGVYVVSLFGKEFTNKPVELE